MLDGKMFANPEAKYRPAPFWSWNHKLVPERLTEQIRSMHGQGLGGFYMHARPGLKTEYLGDEWEKAIDACVQEGIRLGMYANLYDEDCFPSGNAGGLTTKGHPEYAARCMTLREGEPADYVSPDGKAYRFDVVVGGAVPRWDAQPPDTMSKGAMGRYIAVTYEWYKERFGQYFGSDFSAVVPTIFADEPIISTRFAKSGDPAVLAAVPWSDAVRDEFAKRKGYDIREKLPLLFFDLPGAEKARCDFYEVTTALFREAFTEQISDWCGANNIDFTCHYWEHLYPVTVGQGDVMAHYASQQIPGIDMLFNTPEESEHEQFGFDLIVKELSSAAVQTGKKRAMSETHGAGGWDVSFSDQKRMLDWQFALGINYVIPHLFYLSMQGNRKRDFPLSFINEPWWEDYKVLADYIGRLSYVLSEGRFVADVLVLHNYTSTFAAYSPLGDNRELHEMGELTRDTVVALSAGQMYYDLGSEILLARHGSVEDGRICIGGMAYKYLVLPPTVAIKAETLRLIAEFKAQGGFIICTGRKPTLVEGIESARLSVLLGDAPTVAPGELAAALRSRGAAGLRLPPTDRRAGANMHSVYVHERLIDGRRLLFMCNINRYESVSFSLPVDGALTEYDCVTGAVKEVPLAGDSLVVHLYPCGSVCYVIDPSAPVSRAAVPAPRAAETVSYTEFNVTRDRDNMLAINSCAVTLGDGWRMSGVAAAVDLSLMDYLGQSSAAARRQPWMFTREELAVKTPFRAVYRFTVDGEISRLRVAAEYPDAFDVLLNGKKLTAEGYFVDRDIVTYPAAHAVKRGENVLELVGDYTIDTSVESVYVLGGFTVACAENPAGGVSYILKSDAMPGLGDATKQGHPFYCGAISYETRIDIPEERHGDRYIARLDGFHGAAAKLLINGKPVATLGWEPYEADITDYVAAGKNDLRVVVYSTGQNIFGPHARLPKPGIVTPGSFYGPDEGVFFSYGLYGGVSVITRRIL